MQGFLLLNKPQGITSFGAVARIKRLAGERRVGHTGTLDPMATGVLPILLGSATALSSCLLDADKSYTAVIRLGIVTDTCDITGNVIEKNQVQTDDAEIENILGRFVGDSEQTPPMYSALKHNGERLYELARRGETVEIPKRKITVYKLEKTSPLNENFEFGISVRVSKGTYIRSLCRDIGAALGCGATLTALCRTQTGGFDIADCVSLDDLNEENIKEYIADSETAVKYLPQLTVTEKQAIRFTNGGQLAFERLKLGSMPESGQLYRIKCQGRFLGLGFADTENSQIAIKCITEKWGSAK